MNGKLVIIPKAITKPSASKLDGIEIAVKTAVADIAQGMSP
jgi:hypothetical protein